MVTGNRRNIRVLTQKFREIFAAQNRVIAGAMERCESLAKLTFQDGFEGTAAIFENVIVNDNKARPAHIQSDISRHLRVERIENR